MAVAIGAIVAIVIALVITGDDEGDDGAGSSFAAQFSEQLQSQSQVSEDQADCVGEYVVDEIGASRLESLRALEDRTAPPELQEDFDQAVQRALTECEVDQQDLVPDSSTDGGASDGLSAEVTAPSQVMTEAQYEDYYKTSLGLADEDAKCLAARSAEAEASGEIEEGDGISQFYQWVDECGIDPDELFQTIATADAGTTG
ncbi:MAG TPA: hypothetical protein VJ804_05270 [Acidimicrobiales bacterium]|nr:hypothetical protein [Acidimicrobiales bacterium]